jgi:hypothetical protein
MIFSLQPYLAGRLANLPAQGRLLCWAGTFCGELVCQLLLERRVKAGKKSSRPQNAPPDETRTMQILNATVLYFEIGFAENAILFL